MKRIGMTWQVDPAHWAAYKDIHLNPWPALLDAIRAVGIHNYSIFAFPDAPAAARAARVFAYMEIDGDDALETFNALAQTEIKKRWDAEVTAWVLPEAVEGSGVQFMPLEPIFYCA
jgi:L-rhamnose mutarotase